MTELEIIQLLVEARKTIHAHFSNYYAGLSYLLDNPFLDERSLNLANRIFEYRGVDRGIMVDFRPDMLDAFFTNVGLHDEIRTLVIATPLPIDNYVERIADACNAWINIRIDEAAILNSFN